ncbi:reverse transcriptase domain-containing protein [Tanacetum coccineum]
MDDDGRPLMMLAVDISGVRRIFSRELTRYILEVDQTEDWRGQHLHSKRRAFWRLNEDILKITILKTNTLYPSRRYGVFVPALTKRPQKIKDQYAVSRGLNTPYLRYGINIIFWKISNVVPTPRNPQYVIVECLALADLGASINLMPLSIWKKLSLPELTPTQMILELADRSTTSPSELTLRVDDEAITFKVGQTSRYSYNNAKSVNRIDVIDVSCEEYAQEGDLLLLEKLLNDDPSSPLPPKELHFEEIKMIKSSIDDPPELELKDLLSHLKYAFLKGTIFARHISKILLLQEFDVIIRDKKGAENLAADHLSRLENPHQGDLEKKEINETFPLETLGMISFCGDSSTPWFVDIANYHAGNFIVKGMSS